MAGKVTNGIAKPKLDTVDDRIKARRTAIVRKLTALKVDLRELKNLQVQRDGLQAAINDAQAQRHVDQLRDWLNLF